MTNHLVTHANEGDVTAVLAEMEAMSDEQVWRLVDEASETSSG